MKSLLYGSRGTHLDTMLSPYPHNHHYMETYTQESCVQHINLKNSVSNESIKNEKIILVQKEEILKNDTLLQKFWIISFLKLLRHQKFWFTCIVTHWRKRNFMELTCRRVQLKFDYLKVPANLVHYLEAVVTFDNWKLFNTRAYKQGFWS